MPNSLKARLKKLKYQGSLSEEDLDRIVVLPSEETYDKCVRLDDLLEMIERLNSADGNIPITSERIIKELYELPWVTHCGVFMNRLSEE